MKQHTFFLAVLLLLPEIMHAQTAQTFVINFTTVLNTTIIPFLMGIAFLFFVINAIRFFVFEGTNEQGREKAKALAIYGILAFVIIVTFWGIINLLSSSIGLDRDIQAESDYCPPIGCVL